MSRIVTGSLGRELLRFGLPLALGMGLQTTFNLVDAYVIARLGPQVAGPALGALGICDPLSAIGTLGSYGVTTASAALVAQAFGRRDGQAVRRWFWQSTLTILALSVMVGGVAVVLAGPILTEVVGVKGEVARLGEAYLRVNAGGSFSIFLLLHLTSVQRALGSAKTPVALLLLSNVLNLFGAVLLVYGPGPAPPVFAWGPPLAAALHLPRMELQGAAWATILARMLALIPVVLILLRRFDVMDRASLTGPDWATLRSLGAMAWPSSAQAMLRMLAMLLTQALVARVFTTPEDTRATTALGIVFRIETMALFVAMGWGSAAQTFVGQNLGAGHDERARRSGWIAAGYNAGLMGLIAIALRGLAWPLVRFFDAEPQVVAVAVGYLARVPWSYLGLGTGVVLGCAITGAGATRTPWLTDVAMMGGFQLPVYLLAVMLPGATMPRLWAAVVATYAFSGVVYALVFRWVPWARAAQRRA